MNSGFDVDDDTGLTVSFMNLMHPNSESLLKNSSKKKVESRLGSDAGVTKSALMTVNEMCSDLEYKVISQSGPDHDPVFLMQVEYNGQAFEGKGSSKQRAKLNAAEKLLAFITGESTQMSPRTESESSSTVSPVCKTPLSKGNPVSVLNELEPGITYDLISEFGVGRNVTFVMSVDLDGKVFRGSGCTKKVAKTRVAQAALEDVYHIRFVTDPGQEPIPATPDDEEKVSHVMVGYIEKLITEKLGELTEQLTTQHARFKEVAGIVMTIGNQDYEGMPSSVIAVATGTGCLNGGDISDCGMTVNCHAGILACRGLRLFLLEELERYFSAEITSEECIFEPSGVLRFKVKPNIKFYLFLSSPCGDGEVLVNVGSSDNPEENDIEESFTSQIPNRLRTKQESGDGTIPVKSTSPVQTWDSNLNGKRLRTMLCSDKIARWNALGIQGALLSLFLEPVYLSKVVVGQLYHRDHFPLSRTLYGRLSNIGKPSKGYLSNRPLPGTTTNTESGNPHGEPDFACAWISDGNEMEMINTRTGKLEDGGCSKLCKKELFHKLSDLLTRYPGLLLRLKVDGRTYGEAKASAGWYKETKQMLYDALQGSGHGLWIGKPLECTGPV